jgi:hypothetical protein
VCLYNTLLTGRSHARCVFVFITCNHRKGLALEELKSQAREETRRKQKKEAASLLASFKKAGTELPHVKTRSDPPEGARTSNTRKDSSPVKASFQKQRDS